MDHLATPVPKGIEPPLIPTNEISISKSPKPKSNGVPSLASSSRSAIGIPTMKKGKQLRFEKKLAEKIKKGRGDAYLNRRNPEAIAFYKDRKKDFLMTQESGIVGNYRIDFTGSNSRAVRSLPNFIAELRSRTIGYLKKLVKKHTGIKFSIVLKCKLQKPSLNAFDDKPQMIDREDYIRSNARNRGEGYQGI